METQEISEEKKETKKSILKSILNITDVPLLLSILFALGCVIFFIAGIYKLIWSFITKKRRKERKKSLWYIGGSFVALSLLGYLGTGKWPKYSRFFKD